MIRIIVCGGYAGVPCLWNICIYIYACGADVGCGLGRLVLVKEALVADIRVLKGSKFKVCRGMRSKIPEP